MRAYKNKLTEEFLATLEPNGKLRAFFDGEGLGIFVAPERHMLTWSYRFSLKGKAACFSFGHYPEMSLFEARCIRDAANRMLKNGIDPKARKGELLSALQVFREGGTYDITAPGSLGNIARMAAVMAHEAQNNYTGKAADQLLAGITTVREAAPVAPQQQAKVTLNYSKGYVHGQSMQDM